MKKTKIKRRKRNLVQEDFRLLLAVVVAVFLITISLLTAVGFNRSLAAKKSSANPASTSTSTVTQADCENAKFEYFFKLSNGEQPLNQAKNSACQQTFSNFWNSKPTSKQCKTYLRYESSNILTPMVKRAKMKWSDFGICRYEKNK